MTRMILLQGYPNITLLAGDCRCLLKFGTWSNNASQVTITLMKDQMDQSYTDFLHGEWDVLNCPCKTFTKAFIVSSWPVVECDVTMHRKPLFYIFNLGIPILLLLIIGGFAFILPPDSGDKISLSITVFLALTVFIMVVMDNLPSTSQAVPFLGMSAYVITVLLHSIINNFVYIAEQLTKSFNLNI